MNVPKKAYFAHPVSDYGKPRQKEAIESITKMGYDVVNPDTPENQKAYEKQGMSYFLKMISECDVLIYMTFPNSKIGAGVYKEIALAEALEMPIWEYIPETGLWSMNLSDIDPSNVLSVDQTRQELRRNQ